MSIYAALEVKRESSLKNNALLALRPLKLTFFDFEADSAPEAAASFKKLFDITAATAKNSTAATAVTATSGKMSPSAALPKTYMG